MWLTSAILSVVAALLVALPVPPVRAAETPVGTVQTLPVLSVSLTVGSTGRETRHVVYAPPPGWYVRSHRVVVASRYGTTSYAVSTMPAGDWRADEQTTALGRESAAAHLSAYKVAGGGQVASNRDSSVTSHQAFSASHHLLALDVTARGCGFLQGGSGIELTVVAEMVFLGP